MIVVSNTSPLNYLVQIEVQDLLQQLFGTIYIPVAVRDELSNPASPGIVKNWILDPPAWIQIQDIETESDPELATLHQGEREAILLAEKLEAAVIILDEKAARTIAMQRGLTVTGTLGILNQAGLQKRIDIPSTIQRLRQTTFRVAPSLYKWLLDQHGKTGC